MAVPEASARLTDYLEHPLVQADDRLRVRVLIIKGETDQDLDPTLAEESWREAQTLAEALADAPWANRARGELGLARFSGMRPQGFRTKKSTVSGGPRMRWPTSSSSRLRKPNCGSRPCRVDAPCRRPTWAIICRLWSAPSPTSVSRTPPD